MINSTIGEILITTLYLILFLVIGIPLALLLSTVVGRLGNIILWHRWGKVAARTQFTLHKHKKTIQTQLTGEVQNHLIRIHPITADRNWHETAVETAVSNPFRLRLTIKRRSIFDLFTPTIRFRDPFFFDAVFVIKSSPKELAAHVLDTETRRAILKSGIWKLELRGEMLQCQHRDLVGNPNKLIALSELIVGIAQKIEKLAKAHKDSATSGPATLPPIRDESLAWLESLPGADDPASKLTPEELRGANRNFILLMIFFAVIILITLVLLATFIVLTQ